MPLMTPFSSPGSCHRYVTIAVGCPTLTCERLGGQSQVEIGRNRCFFGCLTVCTALQCVVHRGDDLVDGDDPVAVNVASPAGGNGRTLQRHVDHDEQLVDGH